MADRVTPVQRSNNMSHIHGKDTSLEIKVRKYLFSKGLRYRNNVKTLPGKPDIVLKKYNTVIFVNGCFWHHHKDCKLATNPSSNVEFWQNKFKRNVENDQKHKEELVHMGYKVITIWECKLKEDFEKEMQMVVDLISPKKTVKVVAAIIINDKKIFTTQRGYGDFKDGWEFPGGKVEAGESKEEAIVREIQEELDMKIRVESYFDTIEYDYPNFHLSMDCFICSISEGSPILKEHEAAKWVSQEELDNIDWLPADKTIIEKLKTYNL